MEENAATPSSEKIPINIIGSDMKIWLTPEQYVQYLNGILEQEKEKENYEECDEITKLIKKYEKNKQ